VTVTYISDPKNKLRKPMEKVIARARNIADLEHGGDIEEFWRYLGVLEEALDEIRPLRPSAGAPPLPLG
jgi:hypothetical protein